MTINTIAQSMAQSVAWKEENNQLPEEDLNSILECATSMPGAGGVGEISKKPWQLWVPHREGKLQEALACASTWAETQCQDNNFNNVSTSIVFILSEPSHYPTAKPGDYGDDRDYKKEADDLIKSSYADSNSALCDDFLMDRILQNTWDKVKSRLGDAMKVENEKRKNKNYDSVAPLFNPWLGWSTEYAAAIGAGIGQAMAGAALRAHELGYYVQFYTAYRQALTWHTAFGNKFHEDGKWFPYVMMHFGTKPEQSKLSSRLNKKPISSDMHTIDPNAKQDYKYSDWIDMLRLDRPTTHWLDYNDDKQGHPVTIPRGYGALRKKRPCNIPDYHIEFFMKHYGQYSSNAKKLFSETYGERSSDWEKYFDDWIVRNNS